MRGLPVLGMGRVSFSGLGFGFLDTFSWVKSFPFDSQFWLDLAKKQAFFTSVIWALQKKIPHYGIIEKIAQDDLGW